MSWVEENVVGGNWQRGLKDVVLVEEPRGSSITEKGNGSGEIEIGEMVASGNGIEEKEGSRRRERNWDVMSDMSEESGR